MRKSLIIMIFVLIIAVMSGCGYTEPAKQDNAVAKQSISDDSLTEKYREHFEKVAAGRKAKTEEDREIEQYKKDYWLLMAEFMTGGFKIFGNLDYISDQNMREGYRYCLKDLNDDGVPELLLGYKDDGGNPLNWEVYKTGRSYEECYVGYIMHYNKKLGIVFDGYKDGYLEARKFDGEKLVDLFKYDMVGGGCYEEESTEIPYLYFYEDADHKRTEIDEAEYKRQIDKCFKDEEPIKGRRLQAVNLAEDLGIDVNAFEKERALRSYLGYMHYCMLSNENLKHFRFALIEIDDDDIPELVAVCDNDMAIYYYRNGKLIQELSSLDEEANEHFFSYFPSKNVIKTHTALWGNSQDEYYTIRNEMVECIAEFRQESIRSYFDNSFVKDADGNIKYNYCINDEIVTESGYDAIKKTLFETFDIEESDEIRFEDTESYFFDDMLARLEKTVYNEKY